MKKGRHRTRDCSVGCLRLGAAMSSELSSDDNEDDRRVPGLQRLLNSAPDASGTFRRAGR